MDILTDTEKQIGINSAIQQRINILDSLTAQNSGTKDLSDKDKADYARAARGFESMFVNMMLKEMKSAMLEEKDSGFGAETMQSYMDLMLADHVSQNGNGIGLAQKIYEFLTGDSVLPPAKIQGTVNISDISNSQNYQPVGKSEALQVSFNNNLEQRISSFDSIIENASNKYNVPIPLIKAVIAVESAGKNQAQSQAGAKGLMQLMDDTAKDLGVRNVFDPEQNIMGGAKYLRKMLDMFDGNTKLALAAYNAGPGNVQKYSGIPPFSETKAYINKVASYLEKFNRISNTETT